MIKTRKYLSPPHLVLASLLSLVILYFSTVTGLFENWYSGETHQSHGLLLLGICSYIFVKEWRNIRPIMSIKPERVWLIPILSFSLLWFVSVLVQVQLVEQATFLILVSLTLLSIMGRKDAAFLIFPVLLLLSAVPIWSVFSEPLQKPTTMLVSTMLNATGYLSVREGYFILIPEGRFEVGETCSGLRYQIVAITIALLNAYFNKMKLWAGFVYALSASLVAFISNSIRIYIVVLAGHYTQMQHSLLDDHIWLGWVIFSIVFFIFLLLSNRLYGANKKTETEKNKRPEINEQQNLSKDIKIVLITLLLASIGPVLSMVYVSANEEVKKVDLVLPDTLNNWMLRKEINEDWSPQWLNGHAVIKDTYTNAQDQNVDLFISYFSQQKKGEEAVSRANRVYDPEQWRKLRHRLYDISVSDQSSLPLNEYLIESLGTGKNRIVWQWYYVGGRKAANSYLAKLSNVTSVLQGRNDVTAILVSTEVDRSIEDAKQILNRFVMDALHTIEDNIDSISGVRNFEK